MRARLQPVQIAEGQTLVTPGQPQPYVYFPLGSLASVMVRLRDGRCVEVGLIGSEGFVGLPVLLETDPGPHHVVCQIAGRALRMPSSTFRATLRRSRVLRRLLYRYSGLRLIEQAQLVACNALHPVSPRLARWLLMASDRLPADEFRLTQEFLAKMLANDLRLAMVDASAQRIGSLVDRALLVCYHYDPLTGRYTLFALNFVRAGAAMGALGLVGFLGWLWRGELRSWRRRTPGASARDGAPGAMG